VKYPEANRMHKKMMALSSLCRSRGNPQEARRALGRAQCNDAYWHGVFGGLYLRHIRDTVWRDLAEAEGRLREGEGVAWETTDLDMDGHPEIWAHSSAFSSLISPARGGAVEELTLFRVGVNLANTLTRRREAYHELNHVNGNGNGDDNGDNGLPPSDQDNGESSDRTPSIHEIEAELVFTELPPVDREERALFVDRVLGPELTIEAYQSGEYETLASWVQVPLEVWGVEERVGQEGESPTGVEVTLGLPDTDALALEKRLKYAADGTLEVFYQWNPETYPEGAFFTTELSLGAEAEVRTAPQAELWRFPISTFSKSERGFDATVQGESVTVRWPVSQGWGRVRLSLPRE
jgi:alpha-amylase